MPKKHLLSPPGVINPQYNHAVNANDDEDHLDPMYQTLNNKVTKKSSQQISHLGKYVQISWYYDTNPKK